MTQRGEAPRVLPGLPVPPPSRAGRPVEATLARRLTAAFAVRGDQVAGLTRFVSHTVQA